MVWKTQLIERTIYAFSAMLMLTFAAEGGKAFIQGREAVSISDFSRAVNLLRIATLEENTNLEAWRLLGYSFRMLDSLDESVSAYQHVLNLRQDDYDAKLALGAIFALKGETGKSIIMYSEILNSDSTDVEAWLGIGRSYAWQDDLDDSEKAYKRALFYNPGNTRGLLGLAEVLAWQDRSTEARKTYGKILELDSTSSKALTGLGNTWYWTDRPYHALEYYRKAEKLDNNNQYVNEIIPRVEKEVGGNHEPGYTYWVEDDDGLITEHEKLSFSTGKRINDTFQVGGKFSAYSSFRNDVWNYRRNMGLNAVIHTAPGFTIRPEAELDVLSGRMDALQIQGKWRGRGRLNWIESSVLYESRLYEIWSETYSRGGWGELSLKPHRFLSLSAGAGKWSLSDKNEKTQASANLQVNILKQFGITLLASSRYLDFKENLIGYWTPNELRYDGAGVQLERSLNNVIHISGYGAYAVNTEKDRFIHFNGSFGINIIKDYRINAGVSYFETDTNYRMLLWKISLAAGGLF